MFRIPHLGRQLLCRGAVALITSCAFAVTVVGQGTPSALPADCSVYASVPLPSEASNVRIPKISPACASYRSYRGVGRPIDYADARSCAWQERLAQKAGLGQNQNEPTAWVGGGPLILAGFFL